MGRITGLFGVRGWVKVQSHTEPPEALLSYRAWRLQLANGALSDWRLREGRRHGKQLVASLDELSDREVARTLIGASIQVPRSALPQLAAREYYQTDLIGLRVLNGQGLELGRVTHFIETGANAVMVVQGTREYWLPATSQCLKRVDLPAGEVHVDWAADVED